MGSVLNYCRISLANAELLLKQPVLIHRFLGRDEEELPPVGGFWKRLFGGKRTVPKEAVAQAHNLEPRSKDDEGDADKAWNAIHYLLTGSAEGGGLPEGFILHGGHQVGEEEVGYGPARLLSQSQVMEVTAVLEGCTRESLRSRYDGAAMDQAGVYPRIWARDGEEGFEYVWECFESLRDFVRETVVRKQCLLLYLG